MRLVICLAMLLALARPAVAAQLHIFAAGSLLAAFTAMLHEFGAPQGAVAPPVFGPAGLLRARIAAGAPADLFASADLTQPRRIAAARGGLPVIAFAENRLCVVARASLGLTQPDLLDHLLDPHTRLATSTPGADPGGDYAEALFARAEALHPGARAALDAKALRLVGGAHTPLLVPGHGAVAGVFLARRADAMLGYCSSAPAVLREVPGLVSVPVPPALAVRPVYGMVVLSPENTLADRFALFIMSERGQAILARFGFVPVAPPRHAVVPASSVRQ